MFIVKCSGYNKDRERRERYKTIYHGSFHNPEVVMPPCHLQEIFHYNHRRLQLLKHTSKRLSMLKHISKRLLTNKDYKENCLVEHLIYNQRCLSRHLLEIKAIWLAFDSLFYFTTEHLILREKGKKVRNTPLKRFWVRGLVTQREGVNTLYVRSTLRGPLDFI